MSLDPRSLERLRELGRSLPRPLPKPEAPPPPPPATSQRHRVETETDPETLFHELMRASPDGTVPPHLMARLKDLEASRAGRPIPVAAPAASDADGGRAGRAADRARSGSASPSSRYGSRAGRASSEEQALYSVFQQLLLEDDEP